MIFRQLSRFFCFFSLFYAFFNGLLRLRLVFLDCATQYLNYAVDRSLTPVYASPCSFFYKYCGKVLICGDFLDALDHGYSCGVFFWIGSRVVALFTYGLFVVDSFDSCGYRLLIICCVAACTGHLWILSVVVNRRV